MRPRVTVIIPHYNQPVFCKEAIASVLGNTFVAWECLVFDDGSDEEKALEIRDYISSLSDPRILLFELRPMDPEERRSRVRYSVLNNMGLWAARGEYVAYLAQDDLFLPTHLERTVGFLDNNPKIGACFGDQLLQHQLPNGSGWTMIGSRIVPDIVEQPGCVVDHSSVVHRTRLGLEVGGWSDDPVNWREADAEFWNRLVRVSGPFYRVPGGPTTIHRFHPQSVQATWK